MPHEHLEEAKKSRHSKVQKIVGHTDNYKHPAEKAADLSYYENQNLDPLTMPATEQVGPDGK